VIRIIFASESIIALSISFWVQFVLAMLPSGFAVALLKGLAEEPPI
jgi:hypothetical protein